MLRFLVIKSKDFLEFLAIVMLPGLIGIIIVLGQVLGLGYRLRFRLGYRFGLGSWLGLLRCGKFNTTHGG